MDQPFKRPTGNRFLIVSPDEVAEQIQDVRRRLNLNDLLMSTERAGISRGLALDARIISGR